MRRSLATSLGKLKCLADIAQGDALGLDGSFEALHGLDHSFTAKGEGLVMNGQQIPSADIVRHANGLFRGAMGAQPGLISTDRHDGQIVRAQRFLVFE